LSAAVFSAPAYAQTAQPADRAAPAATTAGSHEKMALKGNWRASKLMGLDVYNEANEKLGDVNELILDKNGKVSAVVIGVGGFLGMGEHDIAVSMDKLKFVEEPVRTSSTAPATTTRETTTKETTTGAATTSSTTTARNADANDWVPDHAVMSGTKEQLKAMPQFKYSDYN
jgi:sporulation protein YlmC with PRC-barrel domain